MLSFISFMYSDYTCVGNYCPNVYPTFFNGILFSNRLFQHLKITYFKQFSELPHISAQLFHLKEDRMTFYHLEITSPIMSYERVSTFYLDTDSRHFVCLFYVFLIKTHMHCPNEYHAPSLDPCWCYHIARVAHRTLTEK